jgi:hypothetical protein
MFGSSLLYCLGSVVCLKAILQGQQELNEEETEVERELDKITFIHTVTFWYYLCEDCCCCAKTEELDLNEI